VKTSIDNPWPLLQKIGLTRRQMAVNNMKKIQLLAIYKAALSFSSPEKDTSGRVLFYGPINVIGYNIK
jgi:hypothetical protein